MTEMIYKCKVASKALLVATCLILAPLALSHPRGQDHSLVKRQSDGQCVYGSVCGVTPLGTHYFCSISTDHHKFDDTKGSAALLKSECPQLFDPGSDSPEVCCSSNELFFLQESIEKLKIFASTCEPCYKNFAELLCHSTCAPNQNEFIDITKTTVIDNGTRADALDFYISRKVIQNIIDSCHTLEQFNQLMVTVCGEAKCDISKMNDLTLFTVAFGAPADIRYIFADEATYKDPVKGKTFTPANIPTFAGTC